jgi:uncharacterized protein YdhG (YjbR/CyaY superfamily)
MDDYIAAQPEDARAVLRRVREILGKALPHAEETISYQIPAYRQDGRVAVYFAGWKRHYSIYPATAGVVAALKDELAPYEVLKGTIRFPFDAPIPARLIGRIAKLRAKETAEAVAANPKRPKPKTAKPKKAKPRPAKRKSPRR